jgi:hypothetical protein
MSQILFFWSALGFLVGVFARMAGVRVAYPHGGGRWAALARWALPLIVVILVAVAGGWIATLVVGKLAATAAALGVSAVAAFTMSLVSYLHDANNRSAKHDASTSV